MKELFDKLEHLNNLYFKVKDDQKKKQIIMQIDKVKRQIEKLSLNIL